MDYSNYQLFLWTTADEEIDSFGKTARKTTFRHKGISRVPDGSAKFTGNLRRRVPKLSTAARGLAHVSVPIAEVLARFDITEEKRDAIEKSRRGSK